MVKKLAVYGIGNILMDILVRVSDQEINDLGLIKGTMHLTDGADREKILAFIQDRDAIYNCGGSAPSVVLTLAEFGVSAALSGRIGEDDFGRIYRERLQEKGVQALLSTGAGSTGSCIILISPDTERTMNTHLGMNRDYSPADLNPAELARSDYFFFTGYMWDTPHQKAALTRAIEIAKSSGTKIVFDAADPFAVKRHHGDFLHLIENHFDVVLANGEEARLIFECDDLMECAKRLGDLCETAVVKDGARGSTIIQAGRIHHIPVNSVKAVDTTGAGDTYAAGLIYGLCRGWEIAEAGKFASYLASQIVRITGAQFPSEEISRIRRELVDGSWDRF